jgi:hypothetical protein
MDLTQVYEMIRPQVVGQEIRQADLDGGDSAQRTAHFWAITGMLDGSFSGRLQISRSLLLYYPLSMQSHEVEPGVYRRTSDPTHWGSNPNNFSRDQFQALQLAFAVQGDKQRLKESMLALAKRFFLHQNYHIGTDTSGTWKDYKVPDLAHPSHFSVFIRGMDLSWLKPALYILDLHFLADLFFRRKTPHDYDNMLVPQLAYANLESPTWVSKLAWKLYDKKDALEKIRAYHTTENGNNGINGFYELFKLLEQRVSSEQ